MHEILNEYDNACAYCILHGYFGVFYVCCVLLQQSIRGWVIYREQSHTLHCLRAESKIRLPHGGSVFICKTALFAMLPLGEEECGSSSGE